MHVRRGRYAPAVFRNLFNRGPEPVEPAADLDPALDDHDLRATPDKALTGDGQAARDVVEAAGSDWERRGRRVSALGVAAADDGAWLDAWRAEIPDDPAAAAIWASTLAERASRARGAAPAADTSREQFVGFAELSAQAAAAGRQAIALAPHDPVPWVDVLWAMFAGGRGRQQEFAEALAEVRRRDGFNFAAHLAAVSFHCEKWFGSHDAMFGLARATAAAAPPGAGVTLLPVFAHFEYAMREFNWGTPTPKGLLACRRYFQRPEVQRELDACVAKWRAAGPPTHADAMVCRNWIAVAYALSDRRAKAKAVFDEIGPYVASRCERVRFGEHTNSQSAVTSGRSSSYPLTRCEVDASTTTARTGPGLTRSPRPFDPEGSGSRGTPGTDQSGVFSLPPQGPRAPDGFDYHLPDGSHSNTEARSRASAPTPLATDVNPAWSYFFGGRKHGFLSNWRWANRVR